MNMYYCKLNKMNNQKAVGICDDYLMGTCLYNDDPKEKTKIKHEFYGNELFEEDKAVEFIEKNMNDVLTINFLGKNAVEIIAKKLFKEIPEEHFAGDKKIPHFIYMRL